MTEYCFLTALREVLKNEDSFEFNAADEETAEKLYGFFKNHGISASGEKIVKHGNINEEIKSLWLDDIRKSVLTFGKILFLQDEISKLLKSRDIPFAILKGTSAAVNYENPYLREMGDIDVLVRPDDFLNCCYLLEENGYKKSYEDSRHASYIIPSSGVLLEIHHRFAMQNNPEFAEKFDNLIFSEFGKIINLSIDAYSFPSLPLKGNALILLEHFLHHLETGIGLKQVLDWYMFVKKNITDEVFESELADTLKSCNLFNAAVILTAFSKKYLGLSGITFCDSADENDVELLYKYIISEGNFSPDGYSEDAGNLLVKSARKKLGFKKRIELMTYYSVLRHPFLGSEKWLKPVAFIMQLFRYLLGIIKIKSMKSFFSGLKTAREQKKLFRRLGLYDNGK